MTGVTQLGYLGIGVRDVDEWERFATGVLGLQANGRSSDGSLFLRMDEYHHRFVIQPNGNDDVAYIGWQATNEGSMQEIAERLNAAGVEVHQGTSSEAEARRVEGLITFPDPNGIPTEVYFGPPISFDDPFNSPRPISNFVTGEQGLGHAVLYVDDADQSVRFYRDLLGLRVSDYIRSMTFFHCNPRHHSLALMESKSAKRLNHFMLQVESINDVGATHDLCQDQGVPIVRGMGRHTNDHMVSFYLRTPSGFDVEYGWGAREVDDTTWQVVRHEKGSIWGHRPPAARPAQEPTAARS
ncbi:MAG: VOC family protein [Chloroflexota bacterium]|mgnify:FL=1|jgi:2,3-dihydroxybiphenyl 1,2-dioxygenase|nr:VOC family protein [Chloroflexota bacterium]|tara:strand:+ start:2531 stop:3421 length:891 start_codon:yes stop_codon:yes gene_type:complete